MTISSKSVRGGFLAVLFAGLITIAGTTAAFAQVAAPAAPQLSARSYILIDFDSGRVLAEKNPDERLEPASITKLMTAYAVFRAIASGQINLTDEVTISEKAWRTEGSRMFVEVGKRVPVEQLLPGMIIPSGNDASVALAEYVGGTEETFAQVMNDLAAELGMTNSHFLNSTGLPMDDHYTSARDIATLARTLIREFPDYYRWYSQREFSFNGITQGNRNTLLGRDDAVDGMKTGWTESAGFCLVASAKRNNMRLISVVLGTDSATIRANESQALLNYGFRFFETKQTWEAGAVISNERVWKGAEPAVDLVVRDPVFATVPSGNLAEVKTVIDIPAKLMAPLDENVPIGTVTATIDGTTVAEAKLFAAQSVPEGGFLDTTWDEILLFFE